MALTGARVPPGLAPADAPAHREVVRPVRPPPAAPAAARPETGPLARQATPTPARIRPLRVTQDQLVPPAPGPKGERSAPPVANRPAGARTETSGGSPAVRRRPAHRPAVDQATRGPHGRPTAVLPARLRAARPARLTPAPLGPGTAGLPARPIAARRARLIREPRARPTAAQPVGRRTAVPPVDRPTAVPPVARPTAVPRELLTGPLGRRPPDTSARAPAGRRGPRPSAPATATTGGRSVIPVRNGPASEARRPPTPPGSGRPTGWMLAGPSSVRAASTATGRSETRVPSARGSSSRAAACAAPRRLARNMS
ncbi:MAG: hypothetical protein JWO63_796 [Frankiales bacterium]|nr:hypothetical protein [Frankiales bacterium]